MHTHLLYIPHFLTILILLIPHFLFLPSGCVLDIQICSLFKDDTFEFQMSPVIKQLLMKLLSFDLIKKKKLPIEV